MSWAGGQLKPRTSLIAASIGTLLDAGATLPPVSNYKPAMSERLGCATAIVAVKQCRIVSILTMRLHRRRPARAHHSADSGRRAVHGKHGLDGDRDVPAGYCRRHRRRTDFPKAGADRLFRGARHLHPVVGLD